MPDSFTDYSAIELLEWAFKATDVDTAPANQYLTVLDSTGTDLAGDFPNARLETAPGDWTLTDTEVENGGQLSLGEATADVSDITYAALYDASTGGNEIFRTSIQGGPYDVTTGTEFRWAAGGLTFDAVTYDE